MLMHSSGSRNENEREGDLEIVHIFVKGTIIVTIRADCQQGMESVS